MSECKTCGRRVGISDGDDGGPPVDLSRCARTNGMECLAVAQASNVAFDRGRAVGREDVAKYSNAIGRIEAALGIVGAQPLSETVRAVENLARRSGACASCPHPPHTGMCTRRNGGTGYVCPCGRSTP